MDLRIFPPEEILETTVQLPPSKSIAMRVIAMDFLAGKTPNPEICLCSDVVTLAKALIAPSGSSIDLGNCGAAMRFMCAIAAATPGLDLELTGQQRLCERPVGILVNTLRQLGADITYTGREGFPPMHIKGHKLHGGEISVDAGESSQYISALMMVTPRLESPLKINLRGNVTSQPYIRMTAEMMNRRGIRVEFERDTIVIDNTPYGSYDSSADLEPDWSAAAFWYEIAALTAGWITLPGLREDSIQGDSECRSLFEKLGVLTEFTDEGAELSATPDLFSRLEADMSDNPDLVPALAVTACMASIPFRFSGVGALHHKECDRIEALTTELRKLGFLLETEVYGTVLQWDGSRRPVYEIPVFDTHGDHRMAMAIAGASIFMPGIVIKDVDVVAKSYPDFWKDLQNAGFKFAEP